MSGNKRGTRLCCSVGCRAERVRRTCEQFTPCGGITCRQSQRICLESISMNQQEDLENRITDVERKLEEIIQRNQRVELDKEWEMSLRRKLIIAFGTYCITSVVFSLIKVPAPMLNALIPTIGYVLSTLTLGKVKKLWLTKKGGAG